jgi:hypothetical protein
VSPGGARSSPEACRLQVPNETRNADGVCLHLLFRSLDFHGASRATKLFRPDLHQAQSWAVLDALRRPAVEVFGVHAVANRCSKRKPLAHTLHASAAENMTGRVRTAIASLVTLVLLGVAVPAQAASQRCGRIAIGNGIKAKVRVVQGAVRCGKARLVIKSAYHAEATRHWDGDGNYGVYWRVRGFSCSTGLGGSETFCRRGSKRVDGSTRSDDECVVRSDREPSSATPLHSKRLRPEDHGAPQFRDS